MKMPFDSKEFIELLAAENVEYVVVGAWALSYHGTPRYTGDIDFFINPTPENAERMLRAINKFGMASMGLKVTDFADPGGVVQLGIAPCRIDVLMGIDGVEFDEAWRSRVKAELDGVPTQIISKDLYIKNKLASGRAKDLADVEAIKRLEKKSAKKKKKKG